jgi:hypothetical protein
LTEVTKTTDRPPIDFSIQEAMSTDQLQHLLRQFSNTSNAVVEVSNPLTPWMYSITGALFIYGEAHVWDTEIDIRFIETADDFLKLLNQLNESFEKAAEHAGKGA